MALLPRRDLNQEVAKHFQGTPEERMHLALRLGQEALHLFHATLPAGTTLDEAGRFSAGTSSGDGSPRR